jgi:hypothetical protein
MLVDILVPVSGTQSYKHLLDKQMSHDRLSGLLHQLRFTAHRSMFRAKLVSISDQNPSGTPNNPWATQVAMCTWKPPLPAHH